MFSSFSGMLIHLESGSCPSGVDLPEINRLAYKCYQNKKYLNGTDVRYPFFCIQCASEFTKLSGLYQHAETRPNCQELLEYPECLRKLQLFIRTSMS